jgi:FAD/FMN-containing dehydrogenase
MITGWGNYIQRNYKANIYYPKELDSLKNLLSKKGLKSLSIRGNGRSYGDSSINKNILSLKKLKKIIKIDKQKLILYCSSNCTIGEINKELLKKNLFFKVSPGTKFVTIGGAIASDIHGKNHHHEGCFSNSVQEIELMTSNGIKIRCSKNKKKTVFKATAGGMGLTGVILFAKIKLKKIKSNYILEKKIISNNLKETLNHYKKYNNWEYIVSWIDMTATKSELGRGITYLGKHIKSNKKKIQQIENMKFFFPSFLLNNFFIIIYNKIFFYFSQIKKKKIVHLNHYFYPLDKIKNWNLFYGNKGFIQIQILLKEKNNYKNLIELIEFFQNKKIYSFVTTLKKLGKRNNNYLSFPDNGYTVTFDIKFNNQIELFYKKLEEKLIEMNAKIYLTKDSLMKRKHFEKSYFELKKFKKIKNKIDKKNIFQSFQSKRLFISE